MIKVIIFMVRFMIDYLDIKRLFSAFMK